MQERRYALMAHKATDLQNNVGQILRRMQAFFGLTVWASMRQKCYIHQPALNTNPSEPEITIDGTKLKNIVSLRYLGSQITDDASLDQEITVRMSKASQVLGKLRTRA